MLITIMFFILALAIGVTFVSPKTTWAGLVNTCCMMAVLAVVARIAFIVHRDGVISAYGNQVNVDSLSVIQLIIISSVAVVASLYAQHMIPHELAIGIISEKKAKSFFMLLQCFVSAMLLVAVSNHLLVMWIGLEATTLSTAFLIGFYHHKLAVEAAWKYIILCSIGISIGLVGIIVFLYATKNPENTFAFQWTYLMHSAGALDPGRVKLAFALIVVGIGTKAGFAPMHTWLADAYSEAPTPSAIMSGVLTNLAFYVILRFYAIVRLVPDTTRINYLFLGFGLLSLTVAVFSIYTQNNGKRLLAYSSIENMGIMSLGIGFGGFAAVFGVLLHSIAHTYAKAMLFLSMGNYHQVTGTKRLDRVTGMRHHLPKTTGLFIIGLFAASGFPPFAVFFSEMAIVSAGFQGSSWVFPVILLVMMLIAFAGLLKAFVPMLLGKLSMPMGVEKGQETATGIESLSESGSDALASAKLEAVYQNKPFYEHGVTTLPIWTALAFLVAIGFMHQGMLLRILTKAVNIIMG